MTFILELLNVAHFRQDISPSPSFFSHSSTLSSMLMKPLLCVATPFYFFCISLYFKGCVCVWQAGSAIIMVSMVVQEPSSCHLAPLLIPATKDHCPRLRPKTPSPIQDNRSPRTRQFLRRLSCILPLPITHRPFFGPPTPGISCSCSAICTPCCGISLLYVISLHFFCYSTSAEPPTLTFPFGVLCGKPHRFNYSFPLADNRIFSAFAWLSMQSTNTTPFGLSIRFVQLPFNLHVDFLCTDFSFFPTQQRSFYTPWAFLFLQFPSFLLQFLQLRSFFSSAKFAYKFSVQFSSVVIKNCF